MTRVARPDLSLTEWAVLALIAERPTHGFAIAKELAPGVTWARSGQSRGLSSTGRWPASSRAS
jgi:hypothetical protein